MIIVEHASKSFGPTRAVRDLSFALEPGRMTGLLGPNGAGKTTTIRMIAGYLAPDAGTITLAGRAVAGPGRADPIGARRHLGYLPESAPLYPELRPAQYLDYRAKLFGLVRRARRTAVARVLDRCRLTDMAHKRIGVLSKGYRQRVGLAAAIVHDPPVLILDEPTNGLDPAQMRATRALIGELAEDRTVLLCTHVIPEVERSCARVLVIAGGRLIADGPPDAVGARAPGLVLETAAPDDDALRTLITGALGGATTIEPRALPGEPRPGWVRLAITPDPTHAADDPGGDPAADLGRVLQGAGRAVRHLAPAAAPLEERVVDLIERAGAAGSAPDSTGVSEGARP
jgi:ABC-2 type transport system ATP-binding protein